MTRKQEVVVRILLLVAKWLAPSEWQEELKSLSMHISVWGIEPR